jgi:hypothetical protein
LFYWPVSCEPDDSTVANLTAALMAVGFVARSDGEIEIGFEKIAVFAVGPMEYTHIARQMPSGKWTSKLGLDVLIEHDTPDAVGGGVYGSLIHFMKRMLSVN